MSVQEQFESIADLFIVFDDEDAATVMSTRNAIRVGRDGFRVTQLRPEMVAPPAPPARTPSLDPQRDRTRIGVWSRSREMLHDRETETEAKPLAAFGDVIAELMILLEDRAEFGFGYPGAGVPDFNAQAVSAPPATQQDFAVACIF